MKVHKSLLFTTAVLLNLGILGGYHATHTVQAAKSDTLKIMSKDVIATMDSSLNTDVIGSQNINNTMEGLYRYDNKTLKPALATKIVQPSTDGLTYTFSLRPEAKWSNGDPVTAKDFVFAWQRTVNPKTKSQYAYIFDGIENAKDISNGKKPVSALGVKALDDHTLKVKLSQPIPYFLQLLTSEAYFPQNQKNVNKWGKKYGTNSKTLVFNGPYVMKNWNGPDNSWTEVKNKNYWNAKAVTVKKLQYQVVKDSSTALNLYQSKKLNDVIVSGNNAKQMKDSKGYNVVKQNATFYLQMNQKKDKLFQNANIRRAIALSINRKELTDKILGSGDNPATSATPSKMSYDPNDKSKDFVAETKNSGQKYTQYKPAEAKKLWKKGLKETGQSGKKLTWTILGDDTDASKKQSEFLQDQLEKLPGVKVNLSNVPFKSRLSKTDNGDFDLVVTGWSADYPDPINFLTLFTKGASNNDGHWQNAEYNKLVNECLTTSSNNTDERWQKMKQAQDILNDQQGVIPLFQVGEAHLTNTKIKNYKMTPNGKYNMINVQIK
ncbi:peptide ABC transporter substrate-binding protein [Bombilactobacillus folatiphilus]|uniref:Peptide ABC transporter substrate-binding protein n=1 Tax=Bombilactobacillus folatiphilus TaxID=2923362 RepID=A0ABY4P939_9LACO|nr:peptide ABC transporter substrate-binding protein [Bombilactobacillus folatiphilus]UQS82243.1 peptide ABC transporter substrate-binding protein [Bombilactobacillus folatiphilus]